VKLGSPLDPSTFLSAVIDERSFKKIKGYIDNAKTKSECEIIIGGNCDDSIGFYIEPTVIVTKNAKNFLMEEEIFGPVLTVYVYEDSDLKSTLHLADNTSPYALTGSLFATDEAFLREAKSILRFSTGNLYINDKSTGAVVSQQPFGGGRKSGTNDKAGSPYYIQRFVNLQSVKTQQEPLLDWAYDRTK
jgi:1-pyrroline-5-carboxylate dehydrogenase